MGIKSQLGRSKANSTATCTHCALVLLRKICSFALVLLDWYHCWCPCTSFALAHWCTTAGAPGLMPANTLLLTFLPIHPIAASHFLPKRAGKAFIFKTNQMMKNISFWFIRIASSSSHKNDDDFVCELVSNQGAD